MANDLHGGDSLCIILSFEAIYYFILYEPPVENVEKGASTHVWAYLWAIVLN